MATDIVDRPINRGAGEAAGFAPDRRGGVGRRQYEALRVHARKEGPQRTLEQWRENAARPGIKESAAKIRDELTERGAAAGPQSAANRKRIERHLRLQTTVIEEGYAGLRNATDQDLMRTSVLNALDTSAAGSAFQRVGNRQQLAMAYLQDGQFLQEYRAAAEAASARVAEEPFSPSDDALKERGRRIQAAGRNMINAAPPGFIGPMPVGGWPPRTMDARELRIAAYNELFDQWEQRTADILSPQAITRTAVDSYTAWRLEKAQEAADIGLSEHLEDEFRRLEGRWNNRNRRTAANNIREDYVTAMNGGGRALLGAEAWDRMSTEQRQEFETKLAEKLIIRRLGVGKLSATELDQLSSSNLLGTTAAERVDKIEEIFNTVLKFRDLREGGRADGLIDKTVWQKIKASLPIAGGAGATSALAILIGMLTGPIGATAAWTIAAGLSGGAAGGGIKYLAEGRNESGA